MVGSETILLSFELSPKQQNVQPKQHKRSLEGSCQRQLQLEDFVASVVTPQSALGELEE